MEPIFEIKYATKQVHFVELYKHLLRYRIVSAVFVALAGGLLLYLGIAHTGPVWIAGGIFELYWAVNIYIQPWRQGKKAYKQDVAFYETEHMVATSRFYEDAVWDETKFTTTVLPYDKLKDIAFTRNLIILVDIRDQRLFLDKNSFTIGNFEGFVRFMRKKCPQVKFPRQRKQGRKSPKSERPSAMRAQEGKEA